MNRRGPSTALVLASACLGLAACGSGGKTAAIPSSSPATSASTATTSTTTSTTSTTPKPKLGKPTAAVKALAAAAGTNTKKKPKIGKPKGKPPTALIEDDIVKGKGPPAKGRSRCHMARTRPSVATIC